jgi:small subunit ribosomal protein S2
VSIVQVQELIEAGVHYGHRSSRWNPKMRPYIYGKRNLIHIIDLRETVKGLIRATRLLSRVAAQGSLILFVGTKRQAQEAVAREARRVAMPFVSERWIGGTFTNFRTIRDRLHRLQELERLMETGEITSYSKKRRSTLLREMKKIHRNLSGIRTMNRPPGALVIVDPHSEASAVKEARAVGIPTVALIDTDSDPDLVDLAIPGNDDSIRSIDLVLKTISDAIRDGLNSLPGDQLMRFQNDYEKAHSAITPDQAADRLLASAGPREPVADDDANGAVAQESPVATEEPAPALQGEPNSV